VREELQELEIEIDKQDRDKMEDEFGDFIFSIVNAARLYGINPDTALERTNEKFRKRFNFLESKTIAQGKSLHDMSLEEMDVIWAEAKKEERKQ
jgi:XTP/dITP diphosphohydrolase